MNEETPWFERVVIPALLRHARVTYGVAMREALAEAGFDDVPRNGLYVIGGLALGQGEVPLSQLIKDLRISKQAAGQLVDVLVMRGYLEREVDPEDRRRLTVKLSPRGAAAAEAQASARDRIDAELIARVGEEDVKRARRVLGALIEIGQSREEDEED